MSRFLRGSATVEIMPGEHIEAAAKNACELAKSIHGPVSFTFNGIALAAGYESTPEQIVGRFNSHTEYERLVSPPNGRGSST